MKNSNKFVTTIVVVISFLLLILPFTWFSPNEVEIGGDSNRLYLVDPFAYYKNVFYSIEPEGVGKTRADQALIPFILVLQFLYIVFQSPYFLMSLLNAAKLMVSFVSVYLIMRQLLPGPQNNNRKFIHDLAAILAGLFYTFSPSVGENFRTALLTHNQVFLNPLIFYLILRFFITQLRRNLYWVICLTIIFAPNFSLTAPPPVFAFYPLSFIFIFFYVTKIRKLAIPWNQIGVIAIVFIVLHSFHFLPELFHVLDPGSLYGQRLFNSNVGRQQGVEYFDGVLRFGNVITNMLIVHPTQNQRWVAFLFPFISVLGFFIVRKNKNIYLLIVSFWLITLFLMAANITSFGVSLYRFFISLPVMSMFRNFFGQFQWVHIFYYSLLFGYSSWVFLSRLKDKYVWILSFILMAACIYTGWPYISGNIFHKPVWESRGLTGVIQADPEFNTMIAFIKNISDDKHVVIFPLTDFSYQVVPGLNSSAYVGPAYVSYLTDKRSFSGYQHMYPFADEFFELIHSRNYTSIGKLFRMLNIGYILHSKDPKSYTEYFPKLPFTHLSKSIPNSNSLEDFVNGIKGEKVFETGQYTLYKTKNYSQTNRLSVATVLNIFNDSVSFTPDKESLVTTHIDYQGCEKLFGNERCADERIVIAENEPNIIYKRINPTKYELTLTNIKEPFVLVFSDQYHENWKLFASNEYGSIFGSKPLVGEDNHFVVNGFANAWKFDLHAMNGKEEVTLILELTSQRLVYLSLAISVGSLILFILYISIKRI